MEDSAPSASSPECPVCLQVYDGSDTVPRVLPCGHTACESCLRQLPQRFPQTIRCPACTQLVKFPSSLGPSSLPKNIDLLRLCDGPSDQKKPTQNGIHEEDRTHQPFFLPVWSDEFYAKWRDFVLPQDAVSVHEDGKVGSVDQSRLRTRWDYGENCGVSLVPLFSMSRASASSSAFKLSYPCQLMSSLIGMGEDVVNELNLILTASSRLTKATEIYGLWGNMDDGVCYLVFRRKERHLLETFSEFQCGFVSLDDGNVTIEDALSSFALIGLEMCEAALSFHQEKFIFGCLGPSCVGLDDFGHVSVDLSDVLLMAREVYAIITEFVSDKKRIGSRDFYAIFFKLLQSGRFVSPEILLVVLKKIHVIVEGSLDMVDSESFSSDVWSVGCILIKLLVGKYFTDETLKMSEEEDLDWSSIYKKWLENISSRMDTIQSDELQKVLQMLLGCLNLDQGCRPVLVDVCKFLRDLITKHQFHNYKMVEVTDEHSFIYCLIFGKLCHMSDEVREMSRENDLHVNGEVEDHNGDKDPAEGIGVSLTRENVKCRELRGHLDCVTGLAVGGGFLFSSSFDKTLQLWSLQDFSHVHTFRGHEHKIMSVVYVDEEEQPLCVTVDSGGGIFVWDIISSPLGNEPLKKWYEEKDWRYSGIHSLAYSRSGYIYTGGGDKLIKAWMLQDCTLSCSMEGHKSVVSSLVVSQGALYSGSWDGTIRLWCLSDHSPLTVLGEDVPGKISSVLSIAAEKDLLVAVYECGIIKIWKHDMLVKSEQSHKGQIFSVSLDGRWLFTGGWDKTINIQELSCEEEACHIDLRPVGSVPCGSVITALLSSQGKLFAGSVDRTVKVYYPGNR